VLTQLAITYFVLRRFNDAHRMVDRLLALAPDNPQVLAGLARLDLAEGNLPAAEAAMAHAPPAPNNDYIFEIQVRLALIAHRYEDATRLLEDALAQPPSVIGTFSGKYRYLLGLTKQLAGDATAARANYEQARGELDQLAEAQSRNPEAHMYLAFANAGLGNRDAAIHAAETAIALRPVSADAVAGASFEEALTRVKAQFGETDAVIADLRRFLKTNYIGPEQIPLTPGLLRLDPAWDSLRHDPRFQELAAAK
jgi:tetratricopeptide (TPR) repeat protein